MRRVIAFGLFVAITAVTTAEEEKKKAALDPVKLVGSWQITAGTKNGTKSSDDAIKGVVKFTKDKISMGEGDMSFEFSYTLDTKTVGADAYASILVGASTNIKMWNSSASTTTVNAWWCGTAGSSARPTARDCGAST